MSNVSHMVGKILWKPLLTSLQILLETNWVKASIKNGFRLLERCSSLFLAVIGPVQLYHGN